MKNKLSVKLGLGGWILILVFGLPLLKSCISEHPVSFEPPAFELLDLGLDGVLYHNQKFDVINIVDGDTLDIDIPDGDKNFTRIRLIGVDTPETKHPRMPVQYFGPEATTYVEQLAGSQEITIVLDTTKPSRGKYGRLLAYVYLPDNRCLNEELLLDGFAYAYLTYHHQHYNLYITLQQQARDQKKGLWENVTQSQLPTWLQPYIKLDKKLEN